MTDYFVLLDQPRRPWLDGETLKEAFHAKSLHTHPDVLAHVPTEAQTEGAFAELNEGYQVLRDPKRRLNHLLTLEETPPPKSAAVPAEIERLFPLVARLTQESDALIEKSRNATNALSRSLLTRQFVATQKSCSGMLETLARLEADGLQQLRDVSDSWKSGEANGAGELHALYFLFSYLTRWIAELKEKQAHLAAI